MIFLLRLFIINTIFFIVLNSSLESQIILDKTVSEFVDTLEEKLDGIDILIKNGAEQGDLKISGAEGVAGGSYIDKARREINLLWNDAQKYKVLKINPELYNKLTIYYLILHVRTSNNPFSYLDEVENIYNSKLPNNSLILYIFGLVSFRASEQFDDVEMRSTSLEFLNRALFLDSTLLEARWLRSQIYAKQNQPEKTAEEIKKINGEKMIFTPILFLHDQRIIDMIKSALNQN